MKFFLDTVNTINFRIIYVCIIGLPYISSNARTSLMRDTTQGAALYLTQTGSN